MSRHNATEHSDRSGVLDGIIEDDRTGIGCTPHGQGIGGCGIYVLIEGHGERTGIPLDGQRTG